MGLGLRSVAAAAVLLGMWMQSASPEGSVLFSYVQTDDFCERFEASRSITTSRWEGHNHLARKLATDARNRQKVSTAVPSGAGDQVVGKKDSSAVGWLHMLFTPGTCFCSCSCTTSYCIQRPPMHVTGIQPSDTCTAAVVADYMQCL